MGGHRSDVTSLDWAENQITSSSIDGKLRIWNLDSLQNELRLESEFPTADTAFSPSGHLAALASADGHTRIYNVPTGEMFADLEIGHESEAT